MKKKTYDDEESENEFEVDEPEELQEQSEEEWAPQAEGKRGSTGMRGTPAKRKKKDSSEEEEDDEDEPKKNNVKGKAHAKGKGGGKGKKMKEEEDDDDLNEEEVEDEELDEDDIDDAEEEEEEEEESNDGVPNAAKAFSSGAFVILKTDADQTDEDPPIWKIDGKALLQKYTPFIDEDGKLLYKNTSVYSGWTLNCKEMYYPISVVFKEQTRKEHIVEFQRDRIQRDAGDN